MTKYILTFGALFLSFILFADNQSAKAQPPERPSQGNAPPGMFEYPPGSGRFIPRRGGGGGGGGGFRGRGMGGGMGRPMMDPGASGGGERTAAPPSSGDTLLGGTVPAIWEIKPLSPQQELDELPPAMKMGTIAPAVPVKVVRYAHWFFQQHDTNNDGVLQKEEWKSLPGSPQAIDIDGDGVITVEELIWFIGNYGKNRTIHNPNPVEQYYYPRMVTSQFQIFKPVTTAVMPPKPMDETVDAAASDETTADITQKMLDEEDENLVSDATYEEIVAGRLKTASKMYHTPKEKLIGVPAWFILRDKDGDGQVSLLEFAPTLSPAALALFGKLDKDGDGFITPDEVRKPKPTVIPTTPIPPDEAMPPPETPAEETKPAETPPMVEAGMSTPATETPPATN
ncbi:MAG: hypothetical protein FWE67_00445 [Planctomycetaceae bacterium]|nr:hypothetical protein [Planctomycetaceae bacterium]